MNRVIDKRRKLARRKHHIRKSISGTASRPRMTVFRSNSHMYIQVIDDVAGATLVAASSLEADLKGLKNTVEDAAKLGEILGKRMLEKNIDTCVFDRNGYLFHGIVKSIADGARKAGVRF
ncbi:ribosomal protein L18, bacterial type [Sphaerochaeta pleomorpha str. Grapes]|uniref:Large ribosomal subunit protein uL18 n=1 Tax=Sphaerochaeta pleomorpha (strain ATCC BAA-1885 / DSM 22778 / Grapes) TaxID=158190 RepID=G8QRK4_SPHPG|nr:50S ribosomal protein L18 [Sphaerochaeta pleomorpha]AEV29926.1 ribosomal protein L18, bacterial type [Sphaerochaeta pleomorpha str. Grapes]